MLGVNSVILVGTVIEGPIFTKTTNGRDSAALRLKVCEMSGAREYYNLFEVRVFGNTVNEVNNMQVGDIASVVGRLQQTTFTDAQGIVRKEHHVVALKITWEAPVEYDEPEVKSK
jgi:single-stranded DNA-binding protein